MTVPLLVVIKVGFPRPPSAPIPRCLSGVVAGLWGSMSTWNASEETSDQAAIGVPLGSVAAASSVSGTKPVAAIEPGCSFHDFPAALLAATYMAPVLYGLLGMPLPPSMSSNMPPCFAGSSLG